MVGCGCARLCADVCEWLGVGVLVCVRGCTTSRFTVRVALTVMMTALREPAM